MERTLNQDDGPVYARTTTDTGFVSIHAETLLIRQDKPDALYGEVVAATDETSESGDVIAVEMTDVDYVEGLLPFFE